MCNPCWAEAFAAQASDDHAAAAQASRDARRASRAATRRALLGCGVARDVLGQIADRAVKQLLAAAHPVAPAELAAWTRPAVEPVGWLVAVRDHPRQPRGDQGGAPHAGQRAAGAPRRGWTPSTVAVAAAVMHHAGRDPAAGNRVLARPGVPALMAFSGLAERAVQYALRALCAAGFLRQVLPGGRVAGPLPGRPVHLATVWELRQPLTAAELAAQLELQHALTRDPGPPAPNPAAGPVGSSCTPPSSAGDLDLDLQEGSTGASRGVVHRAPDRSARGGRCAPSRADLHREFAAAADALREQVPALAGIRPVVAAGLLRSWWERHQPPGELRGVTLAARIAAAHPWLPRRLVRRPVGLLIAALAAMTPQSITYPEQDQPASAPPRAADESAPAPPHGAAPARPGRAWARDDEQARAALASVDRAARYADVARAAGWTRDTPAPRQAGQLAGGARHRRRRTSGLRRAR